MEETMAKGDFEREWQLYQQEVRQIYEAPTEATLQTERSAGEVFAEQLERRGENIVRQAEAVRQTLEPSIESPDAQERELAALKLLATAVFDLSVANDILAIEEAGPAATVERSAQTTVLASKEIREILAAPLETGLTGIVDGERGPLPQDPSAAREALRTAITDFLEEIPDQASSLSQKAVAGVVNLGFGPAQKYFSLAFQEVLGSVPKDVSGAVAKASKLVMESLKKLRAALGKDQEEKIRKKAADWLKEIQEDRDAVAALLDRLYQTERIGQEALGIVDASSTDLPVNVFNDTTRALQELSARYQKTAGLLDKFMLVLAFVKPPLMQAVPWGPVAMYTTYAGILGFAVYSGGDYVDWYRTGEIDWLDRVEGLRSRVRAISTEVKSIYRGIDQSHGESSYAGLPDAELSEAEPPSGDGDFDEPRGAV
jgi:hypothetical protein